MNLTSIQFGTLLQSVLVFGMQGQVSYVKLVSPQKKKQQRINGVYLRIHAFYGILFYVAVATAFMFGHVGFIGMVELYW